MGSIMIKTSYDSERMDWINHDAEGINNSDCGS